VTYVLTPNSSQAPLNKPLIQLITQNIQDPVVQQNFEILNRLFQQNLGGTPIAPANIIFGPAWASGNGLTFSGTTVQTPGALQVQITTRGNPVRVKLAPFQYQSGNPSLFRLSTLGTYSAFGTFGWIRYQQGVSNGLSTTIASQILGVQAQSSGTSPIVGMDIPLPAFEYDDVVPTGTYTYQFFFQLGSVSQALAVLNVNTVAYELR
jgi:hypothetical protein